MSGLNERSSSSKKRVLGGILKLRSVLKEKLEKSLLLLLGRNKASNCYYREGDIHDTRCVLEGHFAVIVEHEEERKKLLLPLSCLKNSTFLRLLEEAEEDYGFDQPGALTIPCRPSELERLLAQQ